MYKKIIASLLLSSTVATGVNAQQNKSNYGSNIVRLMPLTAFNSGVGLGLSYERILDKDGKVGVNIPVSLGMRNNYDGMNNGMNYGMLINPGIKFYPAGQRKVSYALGASVFVATGTDDGYRYNTNQMYVYERANTLQAGVMVNNYLQFNLSSKLNIGMELGIGPMYLNQYRDMSQNLTINQGLDVMGQFSFHIGYRF